ncbi:sulfite exporter TauE/SafE family protein [Pararhizobium haloflavum]|uniref:sulfite exporter TauE/SafE family protein n=1 Tax=Pararhizobium haloflavum TaxID=2037914 RepID=UPI001FE0AB3C|nr:sulfite exporter TauE/SafE family protein [Pararhizobium haloflavum]
MSSLLPDTIAPGFALLLVVASFFTSALTAAVGLGGGILMLAIMAYGMPIAALIPVHGAVQFGSNGGRFFVQRAHVAWRLLFAFAVGGAIGGLIGANLVVELPETLLTALLGFFILAVTWIPIPRLQALSLTGFGLTGLFTTFLSMFVGATGPLNAALFSKTFADRHALVATLSAVMTTQHVFKILGFALAGFAFATWVPLVAAMIATGFAGTVVGTRILNRLPERTFRTGMRAIVTVMALDLIRRAVF